MVEEKDRFGGGLEVVPEVEEWMLKITDRSGCAVVLIPPDATEKFQMMCERHGVAPQEFVATVMDGIIDGVENGADQVHIHLLRRSRRRSLPERGFEELIWT